MQDVRVKLILSALVVVIGFCWVFYQKENASFPLLLEDEKESNFNSNKPSQSPIETKHSVHHDYANQSTIESKTWPDRVECYRQFSEYEGDWCTRKQFIPEARDYARVEIQEWMETIGRYQFYDPRIQFYASVSEDALKQHLCNNVPMAMLYAITNKKMPEEERVKLSKQVLVLGYTG
jgi:hypothetical protein